MKTILKYLLLLAAVTTGHAQITASSYTTQTITLPAGGYTLHYAVFWTCNDFPSTSTPGRVELIDSLGQMTGWAEGHVSQFGATAQTNLGSTEVLGSAMTIMAQDLSVADGEFTGIWRIQGVPAGTYTLRFWDFETQPAWVVNTTVWTHTFFQGGFATPPPQYALTTSATAGGSITPGGLFDAGTSVSLMATPQPGYEFAGWSGDAAGLANPIAVLMDRAKSVQAGFTPILCTLTTSATAGGSVTAGGSFSYGTSVTVTATADTGYLFTGWSGDATGMKNPVGVLLDRSKSVQAVFSPQSFTLATGATAGGLVTPGGSYPYGTTVTIAATAGPDYRFTGWSGDASGTAPSVAVTLNGPKTLLANFTAKLGQTISFPAPGDQNAGATFPLAATASSGLPVGFTVLDGPATWADGLLTITGPGAVTVEATQPGDPSYLAAPPVSRTFNATVEAILRFQIAARTLLQRPGVTDCGNFVIQTQP